MIFGCFLSLLNLGLPVIQNLNLKIATKKIEIENKFLFKKDLQNSWSKL